MRESYRALFSLRPAELTPPSLHPPPPPEQREQGAEVAKVEKAEKIVKEAKSGTSRMSYAAMAVEAVTVLNDRVGSSIQAVRKYMINTFELKPQQTASFNNLTSKALANAVALGILDYDKRLFRVSDVERERRKEKERAMKAAAAAAVREAAAHLVSGTSYACMLVPLVSSCSSF
jgi:hypothetical protein